MREYMLKYSAFFHIFEKPEIQYSSANNRT